jgi:SAM-dependent methyltransferase
VVAGFDLAWSRIHFARQHAAEFGFDDFRFCTGQLENIPFLDNSFDVVYTAHAVEPNYGREEVILRELLRVAREKVILFEPSYELGGAGTRARIEEHGYCRGLPSIVAAIGGHIVSHKLLQNPISATNATAALVIEKPRVSSGSKPCCFACPKCALHLETLRGNLYCQSCAMVFPMIDGIPCLLPDNGILAAFYPVAR